MELDRGIIWWVATAIPIAVVGLILYRRRMVSAKVAVWVFTPLALLVGNLVALWHAAPTLGACWKFLLALFATLLVLPFLLIGERLHKSREGSG